MSVYIQYVCQNTRGQQDTKGGGKKPSDAVHIYLGGSSDDVEAERKCTSFYVCQFGQFGSLAAVWQQLGMSAKLIPHFEIIMTYPVSVVTSQDRGGIWGVFRH